jgi:Leucine-rich repeat (LRR) protein
LRRSLFILAFLWVSPLGAHPFNSSLKLKVFAREGSGNADRLVGVTPAQNGKSISVPDGKIWYVRPVGPLNGVLLQTLSQSLKTNKIPGLDLSDHWELSDESLRHLETVTQLQLLDLSRTRVTDRGLRNLKSLHQLSVLVLPAGITDQAVGTITGWSKLRELNLDQSRLTDRGLAGLSHLSTLEILDLSSTRITDQGLVALKALPDLQELTLGSLITDSAAAALENLKTLRTVDLSQTQIGNRGLAALAHLPKLHSATLGSAVTTRGLESLAMSLSLKTLDLSRTSVTADGVKAVSRMPSLEELSLSQTTIGNESLVDLSRLPELRILDLTDTKVTSAGLEPLAHLPKLQVLALSWRKLTKEDLLGMAWLRQVKTIVLNGVPLSDETMALLRGLTPRTPFSDDGLASIGDSSRTNPLAKALPVTIPGAATRPTSLGAPAYTPEPIAPTTSPAVKVASLPKKAGSVVPPKPTPLDMPIYSPMPIALSTAPAAKVASLPKKAEPAVSPRLDLPLSPSHFPTDSVGIKPSAAPGLGSSGGDAENLLQVIALQSNPAHAGGFSGLSSMRQLRRSATIASLNQLSVGGAKPSVPVENDKPENSLGEISVGVTPASK